MSVPKKSRLQRLMASTKRAKQKRVAKSLSQYLKQQNPGMRFAGATVEKRKGGAVLITPIKTNSGLHPSYGTSSSGNSKGKGPYYVGNYGPIKTLKEAKAIAAMLRRQGDKNARVNTW
jgi:hypothetical protein